MDTYDLQIYKGSTLSLALTLRDENGTAIDLSSYTVEGKLRHRYSDDTALVTLTTQITVPTSGQISVSIPATGTAELPVGLGVYDIEITHTGTNVVIKPLAGKAYIYPEATY